MKKFLSLFLSFLILISSASVSGQIASFGQALSSSSQKLQIQNLLRGGLNQNAKGASEASTTQKTPAGSGATSSTNMVGMDYQVHVLGQVVTPGTYRIGLSFRVAEVIAMAGGIDKSGSMRRIQLREDGGKTRLVDLFQFMQNGNLNANPFVQENDVIFVPYMEKTVRIEGPVKKAGIYELSDEKTIEDVIKLAGGYTTGVSEKGEVVIVRYEDEQKQLIKIPNLSAELGRAPVQSGDVIVIPHIFTKDKKFDYKIGELPSDNIFYPSSKDGVFVVGAVAQAGSYPYNPNLSIQDYVNMAGPNPLAKISAVRVLMSDGKVTHKTKKYSLSPGDTIIVPERKMTTNNVLSWYSTLASTIFTGVALRSLVK